MTRGVVAGKFWPLHQGHLYLLNVALAKSDHLDILLVGRDFERPSPEARALAIYDTFRNHDNFQVHIIGDPDTDDTTGESSKVWAEHTLAILGYIPDTVYSSEDYGVRWAKEMGAEHYMVDRERNVFPVSGTKVRENISERSQYLPPATKSLVLPRVVVLGAESTGSTTLAADLAHHYDTCMVPEFGRQIAEDYLDKNGTHPPLEFWSDPLFRVISTGQNALENRYARMANKFLVCDTDSLATAVWYKRYNENLVQYQTLEKTALGHIKNLQKNFENPGNSRLFILTSMNGVPWEDDGTRDGQDVRYWMEDEFVRTLVRAERETGCRFVYMNGGRTERLAKAVKAVETFLDPNLDNADIPVLQFERLRFALH